MDLFPKSFILFGKSKEINDNEMMEIVVKILASSSNWPAEYIKKHVEANTYPNFFLAQLEQEEKEIPIERIRQLIEFISSMPTLDGRRVVAIRDAHVLTRNAANALLKTLEEVDLNTHIILTTTKLSSILPTIRSRCQKFFLNADFTFFSGQDSDILKKLQIIKTKNWIEQDLKEIASDENSYEEFLELIRQYAFFKSLLKPAVTLCENFLESEKFINVAKESSLDKYVTLAAALSFA